MFGLPDETAWVLIGFPLFWIAYTLVFLAVSRDWRREEEGEE